MSFDTVTTTNCNPILVTGSHRSGSTWSGHMIANSPDVGYIHEPFHIGQRRGICNAPFQHWYTYVCAENEAAYLPAIQDCLSFKYHALEELRSLESFRSGARFARDCTRFMKYRWLRKRPLIKDPIALFSADWLARRFEMNVVVLIRHPAAFAGSLKQARWAFPFHHLLEQPLLMEHHLSEYEDEMRACSHSDADIIDQAILLWNAIHDVILKYREQHDGHWQFIRHEDLSKRPVEEFRRIFESLGLPFSEHVQRKIEIHSCGGRQGAKGKANLQRDSKSNISTWKTRLTAEEIQRVRQRTEKIASEFYAEEDW